MEWLLLAYVLIGIALTLRLTTYIAPLQPTWMQQVVGIRYAVSFLVYALMWPLNVGRDRYDRGSLAMLVLADLASRALQLWNERHTITEMAILLSRPEEEVREALTMLGILKRPASMAPTLWLVTNDADDLRQTSAQKRS